jgi:hypothetical protein
MNNAMDYVGNDPQGTACFISCGGEFPGENTLEFLNDNGAHDQTKLFFPAPRQ